MYKTANVLLARHVSCLVRFLCSFW